MEILVGASLLLAYLAGLIVRFLLNRYSSYKEITWKEYFIGMAVISFIITPLVVLGGYKLAIDQKLAYNEFWNGWETAAIKENIVCTRDGSCGHEYSCDPYIVMVSYPCGKSICFRPETRYHSCPYVKVETNYYIDTTLGRYDIALNRFPTNPQQYRWRESENIPDSVIEQAGTGIPTFWQAAKNRLDRKEPGPVTKRLVYENYILACENTILKQYSDDIDRFRKANLLPTVQRGIYDFYAADKVSFVGYKPEKPREWQNAVSYLNAELGLIMEGDLHMVVVKNEIISQNPDAYVLALKAYWQDNKVFSQDAFSKNGICIVVGTIDDKTVAWARAFTGMPMGNERFIVTVRNDLAGLPLKVEQLIGGELYKKRKTLGYIESIIKGKGDSSTRFKRVKMGGIGDGGRNIGFFYLKSEIQPTDKEKLWIFLAVFFLSGVVWTIAAVVGDNYHKKRF